MGNRGRRRGVRASYRSNPTAAGLVKKQESTPQSESDDSTGPEGRNQPEILSIRWKKPRGAVVIQYADGSRYEGGVDDEERRHGTGVHILRSGHIFEGGWVRGDFEGFGMQTFAGTGDCHEGMYRKNHRHGTGTYLWANGDKYVGNWRVGKMHGNGTFFWKNGDSYDGEWKKGVMHGKGKKIFLTGEMIDGGWRHNQVSGWGIKVFSSRDKYEGYFVKGEREGFGKYEWVGGDSHEGTWHQGMMHGKGVFTSTGGSLHGTWVNGELNGQGVHRFQCGSVYTGEYKAGERYGVGTLTFASGEVYEGELRKGEIQGYGSWSSPDGRKYIGTWVHGFPCGRGIFCREHDEEDEEVDDGHELITETRPPFEVGVFKRGKLTTSGKHLFIGRLTAPS
ncbi:hypothetical protein JG688_00000197 [Phytophthora aleatoria]|uniref:Phosphatidylinositol-4-phosphate 5-kinase n=1 Tax=Phytophthora aleatoria TaxID=2496075 RepID=A0A8J5IXE2_9STRA|nr:hypothetical protein JG688_00000197 [Phytophthora aleatoria]